MCVFTQNVCDLFQMKKRIKTLFLILFLLRLLRGISAFPSIPIILRIKGSQKPKIWRGTEIIDKTLPEMGTDLEAMTLKWEFYGMCHIYRLKPLWNLTVLSEVLRHYPLCDCSPLLYSTLTGVLDQCTQFPRCIKSTLQVKSVKSFSNQICKIVPKLGCGIFL